MRSLPLLAAITLAMITSPASAQSEPEPIGSHGASLELPSGWKRARIAANGVKDQFAHRDTYMMIAEEEGIFDGQADLDFLVRRLTDTLQRSLSGAEVGPIAHEIKDGVRTATVEVQAELNGVKLYYFVTWKARDGLAFTIMMWGPENRRRTVARRCRAISENLAFPGPESDWAQGLLPTRTTRIIRGHRVSLAHPQGRLRVTETPGTALSLASGNEDIFVQLVLTDHQRQEAALDAIGQYYAGQMGVSEAARRRIEVLGRGGLEAHFHSTNPDELISGVVTALPLGPDLLEIRVIMDGSLEACRELSRRLMSSLQIEEPRELDAFPRTTAAPSPVALSSAERKVFAGSEILARSPTFAGQSVRENESVLITAREGEIQRVDLTTGTATTIVREEGLDSGTTLALEGGVLHVASPNLGVMTVEDGALRPTQVKGHAVSDSGKGLIVGRSDDVTTITGFPRRILPEGDSHVVRVLAAGTEEPLASFSNATIATLRANRNGTALLVVASTVTNGKAGFDPVLHVVDLPKGETEEVATWVRVHGLRRAGDEDWLVIGQPDTKHAYGTYLLPRDGPPELLLSGPRLLGMDLAGDHLLFESSVPPDGQVSPTTLEWTLRAKVALIREHGPSCTPWHATELEETARRAFTDAGLSVEARPLYSDPARLQRLVAAARPHWRERFGESLPDDPAALDLVMSALSRQVAPPGEAGALLLSAIASDLLIRRGASFVACDAGPPKDVTPEGVGLRDTAFAYALDPLSWARTSAVGEGNDLELLLRDARGRRILVGIDTGRLQAEADRLLEGIGLDDRLTGTTDALHALLAENPGELPRSWIYRNLVARSRIDAVRTVAKRLIDGGEGIASDHHAWLATRLAAPDATSQRAELIADARKAIQSFPKEPALYVILAGAYRLGGDADDAARARACYEHVIELDGGSAAADEARQGLAELGGP